MSARWLTVVILMAVGYVQFLVIPVFINMALGGEVAAGSLFVIILLLVMSVRKREWFLPTALLPLVGLVIAFCVSQALSLLPVEGFAETWTLAIGVLFCLLVANIAQEDESFARKTLESLCVFGFVDALLCFYQYSHWLAFGESKELLIPFLLPPSTGLRVTGAYGQSNLTALLLLLSLMAFLCRYVRRPEAGYKAKHLLNDLGLFVVACAFFLAGSRSGLLGFASVLFILFFAATRKKIDFNITTLSRIVIVLVCGYLLSQAPFTPGMTTQNSFARPEISVDARFVFWTSSLLMFSDAPMFGVGPDHFKVFLPSYLLESHDFLGFVEYEAMGYTNWTHNEYLQIFAETGLLGGSCLLLFILVLGLTYRKELLRQKPEVEQLFILFALVPFLLQAMFDWTLRHPGLLFLFFLLLGIVLSRTSGHRLQPKRLLFIYFSAALLILTVSGVAICAVKEYRFRNAKKLVAQNGCSTALLRDLYDDNYLRFMMLREILPLCVIDETRIANRPLLVKLRPYYEEIARLQGTYGQWYNLALVYRQLGLFEQAEQALKISIERQPVFEQGWAALHALHVEEATRKTGRPAQDFWPKNIPSVSYDSIFKRQ
jgi:O-antigen ligase